MSNELELFEDLLEISKNYYEVKPNNGLNSKMLVITTSYQECKFIKKAEADVELFKLEEDINTGKEVL